MRNSVRRFGTTRTVGALVLREMATTYGRSPGGYLWAVLEPVAGIALLTVIFSLVFKSPPLGQNFPLFYASGFLVFMMYLNLSNRLTVAIRFSKPLLFYPAVRYTDPLLARFLLNTLTETVVMATVLIGINIIFGIGLVIDWSAFALALVMCWVFSAGVGTLNCFLVSRYPVWERVWAVLTRPLFIISAIFFLFETVPHPYRDLLWYNPLVHVIGQMRAALYPSYSPHFVSAEYVLGIGGVTLVAGLILLGRYYRDIINN